MASDSKAGRARRRSRARRRVARVGTAAWRFARAAWPALRRTLAGLVLASWLALYGFWLISGDQPVCQVTTVTQAGPVRRVTTTRSCTLPPASSYLYVVAVAAVLLLPDVQRLKIGNLFEFERLVQIAGAVPTAALVRGGDTLRDAVDAEELIHETLGDGA